MPFGVGCPSLSAFRTASKVCLGVAGGLLYNGGISFPRKFTVTNAIAQGTHEGQDWQLVIEPDEDVSSPREDDNLWTLVMAHRRYTLGDHQLNSGDDLDDHLRDQGLDRKTCLLVPIYAYDHGSLAFSTERTGQFADRWDAGQIGVAYLPLKKLVEEYGADTPENRATAQGVLTSELSVYEKYVGGEGCAFRLEQRPAGQEDASWDVVDTVAGFLGDDPKENGMMDHFPDHVKAFFQPPARRPRPGR